MLMGEEKKKTKNTLAGDENKTEHKYREPRVFAISDEEEQIHQNFLKENLKDAVWLK